MNWIFLNKKNSDEYIEMFARGAGAVPTELETWRYEDSSAPLVIRGIMKHKIIKQCWADQRPFWYMDSGYLGNHKYVKNPRGDKVWHRIVPNNLQHNTVITRPTDRWWKLGMSPVAPKKNGHKILIAAPDEKPCIFYDINLDDWLQTTVNTLKQYTDRPIEIRQRNPNRQTRVTNNMESALKDVHALVTFNSIAATESIMAGVPAFVLAPCNAALPVSNTDLSKIESPWYPDRDFIEIWLSHLAYCQFSNQELADGTALRILQETYNE
tara:strand:- start:16 stop:819 length:804 start_codon:yes stop_codon:yes gene_type:complete